MTFRLGLTGSIGMGKTATARLFAEQGCAVWDADQAVHRLYDSGGAAVAGIAALFPEAIVDGTVSRERLKAVISEQPDALRRIEAIVHPLVQSDRQEFLRRTSADIAVLDIPLLYETTSEAQFDAVACVTVPEPTQRVRVLTRPGMTDAQLQSILARQMPDAEKCHRADYVIVTDTPDHARAQVRQIVNRIRENQDHA